MTLVMMTIVVMMVMMMMMVMMIVVLMVVKIKMMNCVSGEGTDTGNTTTTVHLLTDCGEIYWIYRPSNL